MPDELPPSAVFVDTSFFYACLEPRDVNHARASSLAAALEEARTESYSTWDVASETATLLLYRSSPRLSMSFVDEVLPRVRLAEVDASMRTRAIEHFRRFNRGRTPRLSMCDALTFTVLRETLECIPCLSFDRGLRAIGLRVLP